MSVILKTEKLRVEFNSRQFRQAPKVALRGLDLEVSAGEIFGFLGPNGAGKTTTINVLLGFVQPTSGAAALFGIDVRQPIARQRIGYLPEESYLYRYLNSRETLDFFGNLFHLSKGERNNRSEQLLEMVGLGKTQMRAVGEFSKGMQRRIGLAQALINDPDLVILDEPTAGLDPIGCREVKDLIVALARRGKTVILSSHLLSDVEDVCDRVVIYYGGKIQAAGTLKELLATPDTLQITTPVLPRETLERVLEIIRRDISTGDVRVDNPTQNLESYFLDVVHKARAAAHETSGAQSGATVAAYLRAGGAEKPPTDKVLEKLSLPQAAQTVYEPKTPAPLAEKKLDDRKLEALTQPTETKIPETKPAQEAKPADLSKADEKLSSLLGNKK